MEMWANIYRTAGPFAKDPAPPGRFIVSTRHDSQPQFSPDGQRIVFSSSRSGNQEIWVSDADGLNAAQLTAMGAPSTGDPRWSPDGEWIAFDSDKEGPKDIYVISASGGKPRRLTSLDTFDCRPSWSHDGKWIYFGSARTGGFRIWKLPVEGGEAVQVSRKGGREAFESSDGKYIYYAGHFGIQGIWRVSADGSEEIQILDHGLQGYWALLDEGICLLNFEAEPGPAMEFFDFATQRLRQVTVLPREVGFHRSLRFPGAGYIAVSPDGQWLLYSQHDLVSSDLMLVEDFR